MKQKRFREALGHFSAALEKGIYPAEADYYSAVCCFELGELEPARKFLHSALERGASRESISSILELVNWEMISPHDCFNSDHAFSPDGSALVFASARADSNRDGRVNALDARGIYAADLRGGPEKCLVDDGNINSLPVFSPDSGKVAYISREPAGAMNAGISALLLMDLATGDKFRVAPEYNVKYHLFSGDGESIIFCGWKSGERNSGIYSARLSGGLIVTLVSGAYENTFPSLSRDGKKLLYSSWRADTDNNGAIDFHDRSGIYLKFIDNGREIELAGPRYNNTFPVFSPDGRTVLYLSVRNDTCGDGVIDSCDNAGIYAVDVESGREKCVIDDTFYNKFPSFSPDGKKIVFVTSGCRASFTRSKNDYFEQKGIYMKDIGKNVYYQLVSERFYGSRAPVFSPDGKKLAYVSWRKGTNRGLYLADIGRLPEKNTLHGWIDKNLK